MRAEVVADDRDAGGRRIQRAQVAAELQEPGPGLARLDVPVQLVLAQLIGGEQVPHPGFAGVSRTHPWTRRPARLFALAADRGPLPPGPGLQVQRPELINAEDHLRIAVLRGRFPVGDRVQLLDARLLLRIPRVLRRLPGFQALKGDPLLPEQDPQALVADVIDHPLGHQEIGQLGQAPGGKRQVMLDRLGLGDLLDLPPLAQRELRRMAALVLRVERSEPVSVEVADHVPHPVFAGERDLRDRLHVHALS